MKIVLINWTHPSGDRWLHWRLWFLTTRPLRLIESLVKHQPHRSNRRRQTPKHVLLLYGPENVQFPAFVRVCERLSACDLFGRQLCQLAWRGFQGTQTNTERSGCDVRGQKLERNITSKGFGKATANRLPKFFSCTWTHQNLLKGSWSDSAACFQHSSFGGP